MAMFKLASPEDLIVELPMFSKDDDVIVFEDEPSSEEECVEMEIPNESVEISFALPFFPGAPDDVIEVHSDELDSSLEEDDKKDKNKSEDKKEDEPKDLAWIRIYLDKIPTHRGETLGLERSKSYLSRALPMLSKMIQDDHEGTIDISKAEDARIQIENGISRLDKELQRRKKKASEDNSSLTKEAQRAAGIGANGVIVTVPMIVSVIARTCINSMVSGGKDIEDTFKRLASKWKLTDREKIETIQLLKDMNYPIRRDMGFMVDDEEEYVPSSSNNYDYPASYPS